MRSAPSASDAPAASLLIVDDDEFFCQSLVDFFEGHGLATTYVTSRAAAVAKRVERFTVVVVDKHLPDGEGLSLMDPHTSGDEGPAFVVVTADPSYEHAVAAIRGRAFDYLSKPIELESLEDAVFRALARQSAERTPQRPEPGSPPRPPLSSQALAYARADVPIVISGETGTGKTQLAARLHHASPRAEGPFVTLNCAALPETIAEAELFGTRRGAFSGAVDRPGVLELAHGGTLFLDEVAELSLAVQAKLLSVLEGGAGRRLGGRESYQLDLRLIVATHRDLWHEVEAGRFREDLLYRLEVGTLHQAALRDLARDSSAIFSETVDALLRELGAPPQARLAEGELERLAALAWPGNFRELRNALSRALLTTPIGSLRPSDCLGRRAALAKPLGAPDPRELAAPLGAAPETKSMTLEQVALAHIRQVLEACDNNKTLAAERLGISVATLRRKLDRAARTSA